MKKQNTLQACLLAGLAMIIPPTLAMGQTNCFTCHQTTACLTPTKPDGTCASCHLGTDDVDDFSMNFTSAQIDANEWQTNGHGQPGIDMECEYCHDYDVRHGEAGNPFRLRNVTEAGPLGQNSNCLACHDNDSSGVDPDDAENTFPLVNAVVKATSYHGGYKHDEPEDGGNFCWDCHDPHGDANFKMIHDDVANRTDGDYGIPVETKWVEFSDNQLPSDFVHNIEPGPYNGVCQVCHFSTDHCRAPCFGGHDSGPVCTECHSHDGDLANDGWKPNCNACHGYPPVVNVAQGQDGLVAAPEITGSQIAGAHKIHADDYRFSCYICHYSGMPTTPVNDDYRIQMGFDIFGFSGAGSIYNGQPLASAYSYEGTNGTFIGNGAPTTCENFYCHSNGTAVSTSFADPASFPGPHQSSPAWDDSTTCDSCHDYGPSYPQGQPKANQHQRHLDLFTNPLINYDENPCHFCHYATTNDGAIITNRTNHVNFQYDVTADTTATYWQSQTNPKAVDFTYSYDAGGGTCSNITCHQGILADTKTWGSPIEASYSWQAGSGCGSINFTIIVTTGDALPPFEYKVDWESDGVWDYVGPDNSNSYTYADSSTRYITFAVRDAAGRTLPGDGTEQSGPITPNSSNALPVVAVTPTVAGYTVTLTDHSYDPDYNSCGHSGPGRVRIDWRDGTVETPDLNMTDDPAGSGQQFTHTYSSGGSYSIRYYVYDNVITYPVTYTINPAVAVPQN